MAQSDSAWELAELMVEGERARRFLMPYKFAIDEMMTKLNILKEETRHASDYSPIEHLGSRLKSPESIVAKARRQGHGLSFEEIRENIHDIAGVRVTCGFISDAYTVRDMLTGQHDVTVLKVKDYIKNPKPNGYKSLHLILRIPVFMANRVEQLTVEVQIRTIAMDFWASLEHRIYYKYDRDVPQALLEDLREAADAANRLDREMEQIHDEVARLHPTHQATTTADAATPSCAGTCCDEDPNRDDGPDAPGAPPGWTGDPRPSNVRFDV